MDGGGAGVTFSPIKYILTSIITGLLLPCLDQLLSLSSHLTDEATSKQDAGQDGFHVRVTRIKEELEKLIEVIENSTSTKCDDSFTEDHCISQVDDLAGKAQKLRQQVRRRLVEKPGQEKDVSSPTRRSPPQQFYDEYKHVKDKFPLHHAVVTEKAADVTALLQKGRPVDAPGPDVCWHSPCTSLLLACEVGSLEMVTLLLDHSADVRARDEEGRTALHQLTCVYNDRGEERGQIAQLLIQRGADWRARDVLGSTPLYQACQRGPVEVVRVLLSLHLHSADDRYTMLYDAVQAEDTAYSTVVLDGVGEWYKAEKSERADGSVPAVIQTGDQLYEVMEVAAECEVAKMRKMLASRMRQPDSGVLHLLHITGQQLAGIAKMSSRYNLWDVMDDLLELMRTSSTPHVTLQCTDMSWEDLVEILEAAVNTGSLDWVQHLLSAVKGGRPAYTSDEIDLADVVSIISQAATHIQQDAVPDQVKGKYEPVDQYDAIISVMLDDLVLEGGLFHPAVQEAGVVKMADLIKVRVKKQPLLHYLLTRKRPASLSKLLLLRCPSLAQLTDGGKTSLQAAVTEEDFQAIFAHVDACVDPDQVQGTGKVSWLKGRTAEGKNLTAALYVQPPPADVMDRGDWLRRLYSRDRNLLRLCHSRGWAGGDEEVFTFAPPVCLPRSQRKDRLQAPDVYSMYRGCQRAVILCNTEFTDVPGKTRVGARVDVLRLTRLLVNLDFYVDVWLNLASPSVVRQRLAKWKKGLPMYVDCVMFVVMSHGGPDYILTPDNNKLSISQDLITPLDGDNFPKLAGKPKVFLVQACRGQRDASTLDQRLTDGGEADCWAEPNKHHPKADLLQIYSTFDEFKAMRDKDNGSWFIEELILMVELFGHEDHVEDLVRKANALLTRRMNYNTGGLQVAEVRSSLRRKLFLLRVEKSDHQIKIRFDRLYGWVEIHDGKTGNESRGYRALLSLLPSS